MLADKVFIYLAVETKRVSETEPQPFYRRNCNKCCRIWNSSWVQDSWHPKTNLFSTSGFSFSMGSPPQKKYHCVAGWSPKRRQKSVSSRCLWCDVCCTRSQRQQRNASFCIRLHPDRRAGKKKGWAACCAHGEVCFFFCIQTFHPRYIIPFCLVIYEKKWRFPFKEEGGIRDMQSSFWRLIAHGHSLRLRITLGDLCSGIKEHIGVIALANGFQKGHGNKAQVFWALSTL